MEDALPHAMVSAYQGHICAVTLPDPGDRHVVAAEIVGGASVILTWNLRDFPVRELKKHGLHRQTPDAFLVDLYDKAPDLTLASLANARRNLSKTRVLASDFVDILKNQKLTQLSDRIAKHLTDLQAPTAIRFVGDKSSASANSRGGFVTGMSGSGRAWAALLMALSPYFAATCDVTPRIAFVSRNSAKAWSPHSRPLPEVL